MSAPRARGFALPLVLAALVVVALAAGGAAWGAWALATADRSAMLAWERWALADSLVRRWPCIGPLEPGRELEVAGGRRGRFVRVRVRHANGACVVSVAVDDGAPLVEGVLTAQDRGVTPEANTTPLVLPTIEGVAELPPRSLAMVPGLTVPTGGVRLAWRDLR